MLKSSSLFRNLLAYQIYGANTDVGKTIFSTILCKALERRDKTWYLKPVSTGPGNEADDNHVGKFATSTKTKCLYQFGDAVSPHLAAAGANPPEDSAIVDAILDYIQECSQTKFGALIVETAGGVHSPTPSGTSQADLYRALRLPVWLVADPKLGGISSTISAYESLHVRGYDLDSVLVFEDKKYKNQDYLREYFQKRGVQAVSIQRPPKRIPDAEEDAQSLAEYYEDMSKDFRIHELLNLSHHRHDQRIERLDVMATKAVDKIWYPFTQHKELTPEKILTIDSAYGDFFQTTPARSTDQNLAENQNNSLLNSTFDASASWWTQGLGHGSPTLSLAAAHAAGRYGHVMFASAVHEPALSLAELLLTRLRNPKLKKVFYSDNGSTGMEVAIKMALTATSKRYGWSDGIADLGVLGLKGSYHGDTIGAMDASEGSVYNEKVHWYKGRGHWFDFPQVLMKKGKWVVEAPTGMDDVFGEPEHFSSLNKIFDPRRDDSARKSTYEKYIIAELSRLTQQEGKKFGALVMEPIILGAGGMQLCDPLFQRTLTEVVRQNPRLFGNATESNLDSTSAWQGLPLIHDEVFTGLYRLGHISPSNLLRTQPDISVHAKLLTGGLLPLCTTLASNSIYDAFIGDTKAEALLHGHSYTAHAVGCEVAKVSIETMVQMERSGAWSEYQKDWDAVPTKAGGLSIDGGKNTADVWSMWSKSFVEELSFKPKVESVIALGSVLAISLQDAAGKGYSSNATAGLQKQLLEEKTKLGFNVHSRVLGNVIYFMASIVSAKSSLRGIEARLLELLSN